MKTIKEKDIQKAVIEWANHVPCRTFPPGKVGDYLFAIPNGGTRNPREGLELKRQGVKKGVSDLLLALPYEGYHGLFIELKRNNKCKLTKEQKEFQERMISVGYAAVTCFSIDDAIKTLVYYLSPRFQEWLDYLEERDNKPHLIKAAKNMELMREQLAALCK